MGFINKIEQGLEKAVRGTFSKGGSQFEPVDLANRVRTTMDNKAYSISSGRTLAPNVFTLNFAAQDFPRVQSWGAPLAEELCDVVIRHARAQGYSMRGSVRVTFSVDDSIEAGDFVVDSTQEKVAAPQTTALPQRSQMVAPPENHYPAMEENYSLPTRIIRPASQAPRPPRVPQHNESPAQVVLEINGQSYSCNSLPVVIGRSSQADITVDDGGVSRRHLEITAQDGIYLAVDLGSTNGSFVNGEKLMGRRELSNGAILGVGKARIVFRLMIPRSER